MTADDHVSLKVTFVVGKLCNTVFVDPHLGLYWSLVNSVEPSVPICQGHS